MGETVVSLRMSSSVTQSRRARHTCVIIVNHPFRRDNNKIEEKLIAEVEMQTEFGKVKET